MVATSAMLELMSGDDDLKNVNGREVPPAASTVARLADDLKTHGGDASRI